MYDAAVVSRTPYALSVSMPGVSNVPTCGDEGSGRQVDDRGHRHGLRR